MKRYSQSFIRVVHVLLVVALLLTFAAPAFAEGGPTPDKADPFPDISKLTDAGSLVKALNERFSDAGVTFYALQFDGENYHFPDEANLPDITFTSSELVQFEEPGKMLNSIESLITTTTQAEAEEGNALDEQIEKDTGEEKSLDEEEVGFGAASSWHWARVHWYSFACGRDAFGMGGIFCWKNIVYRYRTYKVNGRCRVKTPRITTSYLSGTNILRWRQLYSRAYMINHRAVRLKVWGLYIFGITFNGIPIGATWHGRWMRVHRPPCSRYW